MLIKNLLCLALLAVCLPEISYSVDAAQVVADELAAPKAAWQDHYRSLFDQQKIRPFTEPRLLDHGKRTEQVIVLVHGLTDSPYFLMDIAKVFYTQGFNVVIPLLPGHGLTQPDDLNHIRYQDWLHEVDFAVNIASQMGETISLGGFSTGGVLVVDKALIEPKKIGGALFLFSAALGIEPYAEIILRPHFVSSVASQVIKLYRQVIYGEKIDGIGANPYRYSHMFYLPARELILLNDAIRARYKNSNERYKDLVQPIFIAHSAMDHTAKITELEKLAANHDSKRVTFFQIDASQEVSHSSLLLNHDVAIEKDGKPMVLEKKNPVFKEMMKSMTEFIAVWLHR